MHLSGFVFSAFNIPKTHTLSQHIHTTPPKMGRTYVRMKSNHCACVVLSNHFAIIYESYESYESQSPVHHSNNLAGLPNGSWSGMSSPSPQKGIVSNRNPGLLGAPQTWMPNAKNNPKQIGWKITCDIQCDSVNWMWQWQVWGCDLCDSKVAARGHGWVEVTGIKLD